MQKARIVEVFDSIQGEGVLAGIRQVFVRFADCNMHCEWCDTKNINTDTKEYTPKELSDAVISLSRDCHSVSLTGGEPLLSKDFLKEFLTLIKKHGHKTYLETNGTLYEEFDQIKKDIDFVAMDVKLPSSAKCGAHWDNHRKFLESASGNEVFIKTVITGDTLPDDIDYAAKLVSKANKDVTFILQPNYFEMQNGVMKKCLDFQKICLSHLSDVRIIPQIHKIMNLR